MEVLGFEFVELQTSMVSQFCGVGDTCRFLRELGGGDAIKVTSRGSSTITADPKSKHLLSLHKINEI